MENKERRVRSARVLLIDDDPGDALLIVGELTRPRPFHFHLEQALSLEEGLKRLGEGFEAILLDLSLPDSQGFDTFQAVYAVAGDVPILVLTRIEDEELAIRALRAGAQDYLPKCQLEGIALTRALRHAMERKDIERELHRTTERLRFHASILENVRDSVIVTDTDGRVTYWNPGATHIYGYSEADMLGGAVSLLYPDTGSGTMEEDLEAVLEGKNRFGEWLGRRKDGSHIWTDVLVSPMRDPSGELTGFVAISSDVTQRKEAQDARDRLTAILEATPDYVGIANTLGEVMYVNRAGRQMVGLGADEDLSRTSIRDCCAESCLDVVLGHGLPAASRLGSWTGESALLKRDGTEIPVSQVIIAHKNTAGDVEFFSTIARDITESKSYEEERKQLLHDLNERIKELRLLVEQMPAVLWTTDRDLAFTSARGAALAGISLSPAEMEGRVIQEFFDSESPAVTAHNRSLSGESVTYEQATKGRIFNCHVEPLRDASGTVMGCIGAAMDVTERRQAEEGVRSLTETLEALVEASPLAILALDAEDRVTLWSPAAERTFGWSAEEILGQVLPIVPEDKFDEHLNLCARILAGEPFIGIETRRRDRSGLPIDLRISAAPLRDGNGEIRGIAVFLEDISDRKRAEMAIRRLASMPEQSPDPLIELDLAGNAVYVNQAARSCFPDLQALGSWHPVLGQVASVLPRFRHGERKSFSFEVIHEESAFHQMVYFVPENSLVRVFIHDRTEQHRARQMLEREALQDRLTELPNRAFLMRRAEELVRLGREQKDVRFAILSLNLDRFKVVNDSLGQGAGDQLLIEVARRISACLTPDDAAARLDSDDFAILLRSASGLTEALRLAESLREAISRPVEISRQEIFPSVSIGIAPGDGYDDSEALLRDAHMAMYRAKGLGGGRHEVYDRSMGRRPLERLRLENGLRRALERSELKLFYQPIVRLSDGAIVAFEALTRWSRPGQGMVPPSKFIPIAEETGLILPLSYWALTEACQRLSEWQSMGGSGDGLDLHLNVSSCLFSDPGFADRVGRTLLAAHVRGGGLVLEMTESALMNDSGLMAATIAQIRGLGTRLSLDDFGTGYSSLSYLQRYPIDSLKIDRSFVAKLGERGENPEILRAILTLAKSLGITVIAEGVETEAQLVQLREMGCGLAQGYLFSRPVERDAARALLCQVPPWSLVLGMGSSSSKAGKLRIVGGSAVL